MSVRFINCRGRPRVEVTLSSKGHGVFGRDLDPDQIADVSREGNFCVASILHKIIA
jgi:hypothetical protein